MTATAPAATEVAERLQAIRALFADERDLSVVLDERQSPRHRELLLRAALPRAFDEELVTRVLLPGLPGDSPAEEDVEWLIAHADVESNGDDPPTWRMRESQRAERLATWFGVAGDSSRAATPERLREARVLSAALARYLARRGALWEIERLSHLVIADPGKAAELLKAEFKAADRRKDLPRCYLLITTVEERRSHLESYTATESKSTTVARMSGIFGVLTELRRQYDARRAMLQDLEKCAHTLERAAMRDEWRRLTRRTARRTKASGKRAEWIVHLESQGGSGKTMFLRWLGALKCLPAGVPYARLDFDFVPPWTTQLAPWLLLVRLARQLDPQIAGRPFAQLLHTVDDVARLIETTASQHGLADAAQLLDDTTTKSIADNFTKHFTRILRQVSRKKRSIILVLDTLEVVVLDNNANLSMFLTTLQAIHDDVPAIRLILSGRFDLYRRLSGFKDTHGKRTRRLTIERFDNAEALAYLTRLRNLPANAATKAIVKRSRGLPISLSLFADLWQRSGGMTEKQVLDVPGPGLQYIAERVLKHIPDSERDVRWMLRYGVIPRRFTKDYLRDCMLTELKAALAGKTRYDNPAKGEPALARYFTSGDVDHSETDDLVSFAWNRLSRHASTVSFVAFDAQEPDTLVFHEDVLLPMRRELRKQRAFSRLHRAGMEQALARAKVVTLAVPAEWARHMRNAVYHAFQRSERLGSVTWNRAVEAAHAAQGWDAMHALAFELEQPDYVDDDLRPIVRHGSRPRAKGSKQRGPRQPQSAAATMLTPALLMRAILTRGQAAANCALKLLSQDNKRRASWWADAEGALSKVATLRKRYPRVPLNRGALAVLKARVHARTTSSETARRILAADRSARRTPEERYQLLVALAEAHRGDPRAIRYYRDAISHLEKVTGVSAAERVQLLQQATVETSAQDRRDVALLFAKAWRDGCDPKTQRSERLFAIAEIVNMRTKLGRGPAALATLRKGRALALRYPASRSSDPLWMAACARLEERAAAAFRLVGDLRSAEQAAAAALAIATDMSTRLDTPVAQKLSPSIEGRARVEVAQTSIALRQWMRARNELDALRGKLTEGHYLDGVARCLALVSRFYREGIGDSGRAAQFLREARSVSQSTLGDGWWFLTYERVLDAVRRKAPTARVMASQFRFHTRLPQSPRRRILASLAALTVGKRDVAAERMLRNAIKAMTPMGAARRFLADTIDVERPLALSPRSQRSLLRLLQAQWPTNPARLKWARVHNWRGQLDCAIIGAALGCETDARAWLSTLRDTAANTGNVVALAESTPLAWRLKCERSGIARPQALAEFSHWPGIAGVAALGEALDSQQIFPDLTHSHLDFAIQCLDERNDLATVWLARALDLKVRLASDTAQRTSDYGRARSLFAGLDRDSEIAEPPPTARRDTSKHVQPDRQEPRVVQGVDAKPETGETQKPLILRLEFQDQSALQGETLDPDRGSVVESYPLLLGPLAKAGASALLSPQTSDSARSVSEDVVTLLAERWNRATYDLRGLYPPSLHVHQREHATRDVCLTTTNDAIAALPLECARLDRSAPNFVATHASRTLYRSLDPRTTTREHAFWIQRALVATGSKLFVDGLLGPQTTQALVEFQTRNSIAATGRVDSQTAKALIEQGREQRESRATRVTILAPEERTRGSWHGEDAVLARRLAALYASNGYAVATGLGSLDSIPEAALSADLLHIRAPLVDSYTHGAICIDLNPGRRMWVDEPNQSPVDPSQPLYTASQLSQLLELRSDGTRPIVIVDVPLVGDAVETVRQLMLRNVFASQLFARKSAAAVVGLGFGDLQLQDMLVSRLLGALANGDSLGSAVNGVRHMIGDATSAPLSASSMLAEVALLGTGLWGYYPDLIFLPAHWLSVGTGGARRDTRARASRRRSPSSPARPRK